MVTHRRLGLFGKVSLAITGISVLAACGTSTPQLALHQHFGAQASKIVPDSVNLGSNNAGRFFHLNGDPAIAVLHDHRGQWSVVSYTSLDRTACNVPAWYGVLFVPPKQWVMVGYVGDGFPLTAVHYDLSGHTYPVQILGHGFWLAAMGSHVANGRVQITLDGHQHQSYGCPS